MRITLSALGGNVLNIAGVDAHSKGFGVDTLNKDNFSWVLSRIAFEFDFRPREYVRYEIATWISDYGRMLSTRNFTLTDQSGITFGRVVSQWCMIDFTTRLPADMKTVACMHEGVIVDAPSPCERPRRIRAVEGVVAAEHRVVYSDIDFNRHMNTMRYIDIMCDVMPIETLERMQSMRLDLNFMREARYGDVLTLRMDGDGSTREFEYRNGDGEALCRAAFEIRG